MVICSDSASVLTSVKTGKSNASSKVRQFYCTHQSVKEEVGSMGCRREEVVWSRIWFGHRGLNATLWLIGRHETGMCYECLVLIMLRIV